MGLFEPPVWQGMKCPVRGMNARLGRNSPYLSREQGERISRPVLPDVLSDGVPIHPSDWPLCLSAYSVAATFVSGFSLPFPQPQWATMEAVSRSQCCFTRCHLPISHCRVFPREPSYSENPVTKRVIRVGGSISLGCHIISPDYVQTRKSRRHRQAVGEADGGLVRPL